MKHLGMFVSMAFGSKAEYTFSQPGVDNLTLAHVGLGITSTHFNIVFSHLQRCLEVCCCSYGVFFPCATWSAQGCALRKVPKLESAVPVLSQGGQVPDI